MIFSLELLVYAEPAPHTPRVDDAQAEIQPLFVPVRFPNEIAFPVEEMFMYYNVRRFPAGPKPPPKTPRAPPV